MTDDRVYNVVLHAKYYDSRFELVSKMVLDRTLRWKIPQEPRALQKQTKRVEMNKNKVLPWLESRSTSINGLPCKPCWEIKHVDIKMDSDKQHLVKKNTNAIGRTLFSSWQLWCAGDLPNVIGFAASKQTSIELEVWCYLTPMKLLNSRFNLSCLELQLKKLCSILF